MLKEITSLALACVAFAGLTPTALGQGVAYLGDVDSIDSATLRSLNAGALGAMTPPPAPPVKPQQNAEDASFLSKLKPAWLFGSKKEAAPVDPFAAAATQARANAIQPANVASPIPAFVATESSVTTAAYSDRQRGNLNLRPSTSRSRGILSGVWGDSKPSTPSRTSKPSKPKPQPKPQVVANNGPAGRSSLRPGVGSQRRWGKPSQTAIASRPVATPKRQPSRPKATTTPKPNPLQIAGPRTARPLPTPSKPKPRTEPAGDFLMVSDDQPSKAPAKVAKQSAPKPNPFVTAASEPKQIATPAPATKVDPKPPVAEVVEEKEPSIIASVRPAVPPATEEMPPIPQAPQQTVASPKALPEPEAIAATPTAVGPSAAEPTEPVVTPPTTVKTTVPEPVESPKLVDSRSALLAPLVEAAKQTEPTERSKALLVEAHDLAGRAATADDYTAVVKRCRYVLAIDRSLLAKQYANSLAGWALTKRGDAFDDAGRYEEAQNDYHEALRCDPECWRAEHRLGVCAARDGQLEEARRRFDRTIDINPEFAKPYSNRAALAVQSGDLQSALDDYGRAIEIDPDLAVAHSGRGRVCHMLGLLDEGLRHLDAAELLTPNDPMVAAGRGDVLVDLGAYGQALTAYRRAIEIDPNTVAAYRNLAWMLATCPMEAFRDGEAALAHAEQAEALLGEADDLLLDTKAAALAAAGRFEEATQTLQHAIELAPESDAAAYRERLALYEQGEAFISQPVGVRHAAYNDSEMR